MIMELSGVCVLSGLFWSVFGFTGGIYMIESCDKKSPFSSKYSFFGTLQLKSCLHKSLFSGEFSLYSCKQMSKIKTNLSIFVSKYHCVDAFS